MITVDYYPTPQERLAAEILGFHENTNLKKSNEVFTIVIDQQQVKALNIYFNSKNLILHCCHYCILNDVDKIQTQFRQKNTEIQT